MEPTQITVNPISDAARTILYNELCAAMIEGLKAHSIQYESAQESAKTILQLDSIKTYPELLTFLEEVSEKWPVYKPVYFLVKEVEAKVADEAILSKVVDEIKKFQ